MYGWSTVGWYATIFVYCSKSMNLTTMQYGPINVDPEIMSGVPVFAGTRVPVQNLFDYIEGGEDLSEFLDDFPSVTIESAVAVLEMAKKTLTSEKLLHENFAG